jgi:hypothetical protein
MKTNVEQLVKFENETMKSLNELRPIVFDLFGKGVLGVKMFQDENYLQITNYTWGSEEYIEKLNKLVTHYEFAKTFWYNNFNVQEAIDKYNHYCCGVLMREAEKKRILTYVYFIWMLNMVSGELRNIIVSSN